MFASSSAVEGSVSGSYHAFCSLLLPLPASFAVACCCYLCMQDLTLLSMRRAIETATSGGTADVTVLAIEGTNDLDYPLPKTRGSTNR